ncbi:MAG: type IX secretion system membrane protein PorP/SprF [Bacteroidales bacterium]|jgi:type IX secretion system PorP/SprF family membrane protein|nr:type IX secretion system membrane protein PorP/SprF [Bacteroidales bacterium]
MSRFGNKSGTIFCLLLTSIICHAQNDPLFNQYRYNGLAINPASAGSREALNLSLCYRSQWSQLPDAPVTQTLTGDFPLLNPRIAIGLLFVNDRIGIYKKTGIYGAYAFRIPVRNGKFSLGLQGGFDVTRENQRSIKLLESGDPLFLADNYKVFMPNVGAGVFYQTPAFFAGLSVPRLLHYVPSSADTYKSTLVLRNAMLYSGYTLPAGGNVKIKPSVLMYFGQNIFLADVNCNISFLPGELLEIGASYRSSNVWVVMAEVRIHRRFCIGYAYDHAMGTANITNGSHEIMLRYEFRHQVNAENPLYLR